MSKDLKGKKVSYVVPGTQLQQSGMHMGTDHKGDHHIKHDGSGRMHVVKAKDSVLEHTEANMRRQRAAYDKEHKNGPLHNVYPSTSELTAANSSTSMANPPVNPGV